MQYVELKPDLDACLETQAKRQYNQITKELLEKRKPEHEMEVVQE